MNIPIKSLLTLLSVAVLAYAFSPVPAQTGEEVEWISLFDGETLNGWVQKNGTASYEVVDGAIVGTTAPNSPNSFLCTFNEFGNFELEFDIMLYDDELNSGVQIRSQTREPEEGEEYGRVNGPQVEIEASSSGSPEAGYIYGESAGGWRTAEENRVYHDAFNDGEWNHYRIVAEGPRIQTWINGEKIDDLWDEQIYMTHPRGFIGLQVHSISEDEGPYRIAWKNIRIKPL